MSNAVMPNIEAVCISALNSAGIRASSSIPNEPTWPLVTLTRIGGVPAIRQKLDAANIQVDVWGPGEDSKLDGRYGKPEAFKLAGEARLVLLELEATESIQFKAVVSAVDDWTGMTWVPDEDNRARYVFGVTVSASTTA